MPEGGQNGRFLDSASAIAREIIEPRSAEWDRCASWPEPAVRALQAEGLGGLVVPRKYGGCGQDMLALVQVCEILGRADASTALCFGMHSVATACLVAKASDEHVEAFLQPIARGEHWTTLALSEPGTGSHFYLPETRMSARDGAYTLHGTKCFVTNGGHADSYVVSTVADDESLPGHFSMIMVPAEATAGRWQDPWNGWGMRANSSMSLALDGVSVPVGNRLGEEGDQIWYVFHVVAPYFLLAMAGTYLGVATRAVEETRGHLTRRIYSHSGAALAESDILQHRLGMTWAMVERSRRLCYWAATEAGRQGPEALQALCVAKADVGHAAVDVVNECMTLVGGTGYRDGSILHRLLRDARAAHVMSPTTDILYTWAGRALLDLPLLGE